MILGILQARTSSSRFPQKVLKPLLGRPMLMRQIERLRKVKGMDRLIIATSVDPSDDAIEKLCREENVEWFRGNLNDVLDRFYQAAKPHRPDHVVRLTGDCPLADPAVIDELIQFYKKGGYDYASNTIEPTYPDGLDAEIMTFAALETAWKEAPLSSEREHVTSFIYKHPERFRLGNFKNALDLSALRWTVDEPVDFELVEKIYAALYPKNPFFSTPEILKYIESNPELKSMNKQFKRNEGYEKSLKNEVIVK